MLEGLLSLVEAIVVLETHPYVDNGSVTQKLLKGELLFS